MENEFYSFTADSISGVPVSMESYRGKVVVVVNTASKCGFTPQYASLEKLYKKYQDRGLVILGFPCNQFGGQEPNSEKEIAESCLVNYGVTFKMFSKVDVNGDNAHPIFRYLKKELKGFITNRIKWNFTKFIIDRNGRPYKRYSPMTDPMKMEKDILKLL